MKLRQKLAAVLAATMVVTAVPAVTMAKSDTSLVTGIQIKEKDDQVSTSIKVEMKDATSNPFMFFVNVENAEFVNATETATQTGTTGTATVTLAPIKGGKEMKVTVTPTGSYKGTITLPLNVELKGGDATVAIDGAGSVISDMAPIVFARTSDSKATVTVDDAEAIYTDATEVASIKIEEAIAGKLAGKAIEVTSRHADYDIISADVSYEKGFTGTTTTITNTNNDKGVLTIPASAIPTSNGASGRLVVKLTMKSNTKSPSTGDLNVKVSGDKVTSTIVKVGEVKNYGTIIEMKDKKVVDVNAGKKEEVTFTIKEAVADTFVANREFDVTFDKGFLSNVEKATVGQLDLGTIEFNNGTTFNGDTKNLVTDVLRDKDDYVYGFTLKVPAGALDNTKIDKITFKDMNVFVPAATEGDITVKVGGRSLGYEASTVAMNAVKAIEVKAEPVTVKVGLKEQTGGKIVISETDKGMFDQGEYILLKLEEEDGLTLKDEDYSKNGKIEVTSGDLVLDLEDASVSNGVLAIKVKRASTEASTITIKDLKFHTDRTLPQGTYEMEIAGRAFAPDWTTEGKGSSNWTGITEPLSVKDFVIVGTPNTEDITSANGLRKGTTSFVINSNKYVVNGVEAEMDAAAYLDPAGRTMVPLRFVANALGIDDKEIFFANNTATIIAAGKTISVEIGSKTAKLNGVAVRTMDTAPVLKNDRTYVPVGELAALLGVEATWDGATQTATFTNK